MLKPSFIAFSCSPSTSRAARLKSGFFIFFTCPGCLIMASHQYSLSSALALNAPSDNSSRSRLTACQTQDQINKHTHTQTGMPMLAHKKGPIIIKSQTLKKSRHGPFAIYLYFVCLSVKFSEISSIEVNSEFSFLLQKKRPASCRVRCLFWRRNQWMRNGPSGEKFGHQGHCKCKHLRCTSNLHIKSKRTTFLGTMSGQMRHRPRQWALLC